MCQRINILIMSGQSFILRESRGIPYYSCCSFESLPYLHHGFSTRHGGSLHFGEDVLNRSDSLWDLSSQVDENRRRFLSAVHLEGASLVTLRQVHSNRVHIIEDAYAQWYQTEGDALITRTENIALAVKTADCLPVLIADPERAAVGAVHSGWRGTLSQVLIQTIAEMQRTFNSDPCQLLVAVGPGIRRCCFEVGQEVADLFHKSYPGCRLAGAQPGKHFVDLAKALNIQMDVAGIRPENRFDLDACTCCNTQEFFSHRTEGSKAGRMLAVIGFSSVED